MPRYVVGFVALATFLLICNDKAAAQVFHPDSELGPYVHQATLTLGAGATDDEFGRRMAIAGDVALVAGTDVVYVFERDPATDTWQQAASIQPLIPVEDFGIALAMRGKRAIVGSLGAAHIFRRGTDGQWQEIATLQPSDLHPTFGRSVDITGTRAIVGAPGFFEPDGTLRTGAAYIFDRDQSSGSWNEAAILSGGFGFGVGVGINGDAAIVAESIGPGLGQANIFTRSEGEGVDWTLVEQLRLGGLTFLGDVDIHRRAAVLGHGEIDGGAFIFGRDVGGPDEWGREGTYLSCCGTFRSAEISSGRIILGLSGLGSGVHVLARNQGGQNAWERIALFRPPSPTPPSANLLGAGVAMNRDTALLGAPGGPPTRTDDNAVFVVVSDLDGDTVRDELDPCVRDPYNNVEGGCQRASWAHPVVDDLIVLSDMNEETVGRRHIITATFTNSSTMYVKNPFFEVTELGDGHVLLNADEGRGGVGATLSPDVGDGLLAPGESMTVTFRIRLQTENPVQFAVAFHGDPL